MWVYSIYDKAAGLYSHLMLSQNDAVIARDLRQLTPETAMYRTNSDDFQLRRVGEFDQESGDLTNGIDPKVICEMSSLFNREES